MPATVSSIRRSDTQPSEAEKKARIDCAAAHRLSEEFGWTQLIYNHISQRVPDDPSSFLIKPHGLMFNEICASNLAKISYEGGPTHDELGVNSSGYAIHSAILKARPDVNAAVHIHTDAGMAISAHKGGLKPMTQAALRFHNRIAYHKYEAFAQLEEGPALVRDLKSYNVMILHNHGLLACAATMGEAISKLHFLIVAIRSQLMLEATGQENVMLAPEETREAAAQQWDRGERRRVEEEWPALLRWMERIDPSYRD